jgi:hypothetical protein
MTMAGLDEQKYIKENRYTTEFWNTTLIGKSIPFTQVGYTSFIDDKPTSVSQDYRPGAYSVYSKQIKYPKDSMSKTFDTIETLDSHKRLEHSELGQSKPPAGVG